MPHDNVKSQRILELFLLVIGLSLAALLHEMAGYQMIVLNLFYLPVVLAGFYLGRYRGGLLALFCVIVASIVTALDWQNFAAFNSPLAVALAVLLWGAVLGLTAMLVGTLSDERNSKIVELHEAYVGVVEVLSRYLQSANPALEARSSRVARLSQAVAQQLRLTPKQVDDIRVAALLYDMENIEITARVLRKAVGNLEDEQEHAVQHTFCGADLVHSLGSVLTGAMPLLLNQGDQLEEDLLIEEMPGGAPVHLGINIIRTARAFVALRDGGWGEAGSNSSAALDELRDDPAGNHDPSVIDALEQVLPHLENANHAPALSPA